MKSFTQYLTEAGKLFDYDYVARQHGYKKTGEHTPRTVDPKTGAGAFYGSGGTVHQYEHPNGQKFTVHERKGQFSFIHGPKYGKTPNGLDSHLSTLHPKPVKEGVEEHEKFKDHTKNPYHEILTKHGFQHQSTTHEKNPFAKDNPRADTTVHRYTHPAHGKSSVTVDQEHDPNVGHGGMKSKGHGFLHRHEQSNGIMAPSHGDSKPQLHRSLSYHYGVPKGMEAPKLTASEKKYEHIRPTYKMND